ncbi:phosphatase PAP2 family protein [Weissella viridescens]|nr:phosphatase PAP2 family protein [Weissella viridescens]
MSVKKQYQVFGLASSIFLVLMLIGTGFDLAISRTFMNQNSWYGTFFQIIGILPMYLVVMVSGEIGMAYGWRVRTNRLFANCLMVGSGALGLWQTQKALKEVLSYGGAVLHNVKMGQPVAVANSDMQVSPLSSGMTFVIAVVIFILFTCLIQLWLTNKSVQQLEGLLVVAVFATLTVLLAMAVNGALKQAWGRARPYELMQQGNHFTAWYTMNGANGHKSFPSGHAMAATLTVVLAWFTTGKWHKLWWFGGIGFTVIVDLARVRVGAHFLTDVTCSTFLTFAIIYVMWGIYQQIQPALTKKDQA